LFLFTVNVTAKVSGIECRVAWPGEVFGGTAQRSTEQQNHNDDDEQEAAHASADVNRTGKNRQ
jgi:hypothetical protein